MRTLIRAALPFVLLLSGTASAIEIEAGGRTIEIPVPAGFSELTPEMSPMYEAMYAYTVPSNERYAIFVPAESAEALLRGEDAEFDRYMIIEAERQTIRANLSDADFDEFRELLRGQLNEMLKSVDESLPGLFDDASESMSEALDADLQLSVGEIIPFEAHLDTERAYAYTQLISMGVAVDGENLEPEVGMATATFLNVNGKLLFVYVYGGEEDMEWSRVFAANWTDQILAANDAAQTPASTQAAGDQGADNTMAAPAEQRGMDWGKVMERGLIGALIGGAIALFAGLLSRRRRKQD